MMKRLHLHGIKLKLYMFLINRVYCGTKHFETKRKLLNSIGFQIGDGNRRAGPGVVNDIAVGDGTWICARSTVYNNIVIGNSCIVACCACVNKDVPDNSLVGGVPAKIIKVLE